MKLEDLYPYWPAAHEELVDKLRYIDDAAWEAAPLGPGFGSIRLLVQRYINFERHWMIEIVQGRKAEAVTASMLHGREDYISEFKSVRAATDHYLAALPSDALRSVRTAPADPVINEIERNVPLSWILWRLMEEELMTFGQIRALVDYSKPRMQR